jgi:hypothetical protein
MEEFVFRKWDYGLTSLSGYFSRRFTLSNLKKYKKYKLGTTKNNIPVYKWNWGMWFQIFINGNKKPRKSVGIVEHDVGTVSGKIDNKKSNRKPYKELM